MIAFPHDTEMLHVQASRRELFHGRFRILVLREYRYDCVIDFHVILFHFIQHVVWVAVSAIRQNNSW